MAAAPRNRTVSVLVCLVAAMAMAAALLTVLEPAPTAPATGIRLTSLDRESEPENTLFNTVPSPKSGRWAAIVIHYSGSAEGSLKSITQAHEKVGKAGGGYHFVINNGSGKPDGEIEMSFRWQRQVNGEFGTGSHASWHNQHSIGICLVGDPQTQAPTDAQMRELEWLVCQLQAKFNINADHILVESSLDNPGVPARFFPIADFQQKILHQTNP